MKNERLNAFLSQAGVCSRREADQLIKDGKVTINHWPVTDPAYRIQENDTVRYKKKIVSSETPVYLLLHKPKGYVTSCNDDLNRPTVLELIDTKIKARVYPVGRLDINTTGALLLTNDGNLSLKLSHPKFGIRKIYQVTLTGPLTEEHKQVIERGIHIDHDFVQVDSITQGRNPFRARVVIHSGKNRVVRRLFEHFGYTIKKLDRVSFASLSTKDLPLGHTRHLKPDEVEKLKAMTAVPLTPSKKPTAKKSSVKKSPSRKTTTKITPGKKLFGRKITSKKTSRRKRPSSKQ